MNYERYMNRPEVGSPALGTLFFGCFYLLFRGLWFHAFMLAILALPTAGLAWIWYIFNARKYITKKLYLQGVFDESEYAGRIYRPEPVVVNITNV